jgi:hypothetical protein
VVTVAEAVRAVRHETKAATMIGIADLIFIIVFLFDGEYRAGFPRTHSSAAVFRRAIKPVKNRN